MSLKLTSTAPPAPTTTRGEATVLNAWMGPPRGEKGPRVVYGNGSSTYLRKVDARDGEVLVVRRNKHPVTVAQTSPSGSYCAAGDQDGNVIVFALDNEDKTVKLEKKVVSGRIHDIGWSGDSQRMIAVGDGKDGFAAAFVVDGGNTQGTINGHSRTVHSCDFRKERPFRIATGGSDNLFNWFEGPPFKFKSQASRENNVNSVRFSPDGSVVVAAGSDKKIVVHDGKTGEQQGEIPCDHKGSIYQVAFSPDGKNLVSSSADKTVKLWDVEGKSLVQTFSVADTSVEYMQVGCTYAGDHILSLGLNGDINVFKQGEEKPVKVLRGHQKTVNQIVAHNSGAIATISSDPSVIIWPQTLSEPEVSVRPSGKKAHTGLLLGAAFVGDNLITGASDDSIGVSHVAQGTFELAGKVAGGVCGIAAVDESAFVATSKGIFVLDGSGAEKGKVATDYTPSSIASSPQTKAVAVGAREKKVVVYAAKGDSLEPVGEIGGFQGIVTTVAFSPDGTKLAVGTQSRELGVYDAAGLAKLEVGVEGSLHTTKISTVSFNASGTLLLSGAADGKAIVWSLEKKAAIAQQDGAHHNGVSASLWTGEDEVITGGADAALRVWKLAA
eukprot:Hpha_TRINITY_DN15970_c0_g1::TRINITY_DN15970_c0_g1_i1::g.71366::m.71366